MFKIRITYLDLSTTPLMNVCCNVDMIELSSLRSQSLFQFVQSIAVTVERTGVEISHALTDGSALDRDNHQASRGRSQDFPRVGLR